MSALASKCENLAMSKCLPVCPSKADLHLPLRRVAQVPMLSKNSVISEVGGVCETDDLFCSCFRGQLLGPGGQMVLSTQLTLTPV